jgi:hypothetical protein
MDEKNIENRGDRKHVSDVVSGALKRNKFWTK